MQLWAGLRFTVPRAKDTQKTVQFDLQIRRCEPRLSNLANLWRAAGVG